MKIKRLAPMLSLAIASFFACSDDESVGKIGQVDSSSAANEVATSIGNQTNNPDFSKTPLDSNALTEIFFESKKFDFGETTAGEIVCHVFKFKNVGKSPLLISNVYTSCGCTQPEWTKEPVQPDSTSEIIAKFDTKNREGKQFKLIFVKANCLPRETELVLTGFVK